MREATKLGYSVAVGGDSINLEQPNSKTRRGRVGQQIANTLTTSCNQGVVVSMNTNKIIKEIIPQRVKIRKYNVDTESLKKLLRNAKKDSCITNKQISVLLDKPLTLVEHWFRCDDSFSIPSEDVWFELKELLKIDTEAFDKEITTFEIRDGVFDKSNRVYDSNGIAPTLTCANSENERYMVYMNTSELIQVGILDGKHEQSNRVYDEEGLCPTIMAGQRMTCMGGYVSPKILTRGRIMCNETRLVGGIGEINFGNQFRQGNRVYDSEAIAMCLMAQPLGNSGGYSYLYKVSDDVGKNEIKVVGNYMPSNHDASRIVSDDGIAPCVKENHGTVTGVMFKNKLKGGDKMWYNDLEKFNFSMDEIRVFDVFAGIGSLHQSLKDLGVPVRVTNLSEIDIDATISYAGGHIENFKDSEFEYPSDEEMKKWLIDRNIGYSYEKGRSSVPRMKKEKLRLAYKASYLLNNLGDISKINYEKIEDFDLLNFSFSCTDLSNAGKQKGMKNDDGTPTRSGLYVYGIEAIRAKRPKYIMIENVKGLIQKKFIDDFYSIIDELEEIGYSCYYPTKEDKKGHKSPICLNAKNFGIPQNRERIFVICVRKDIDNGNFVFPNGFDSGVRLKDVLEEIVDDKYYLSQEVQNRFKFNGKTDSDKNELNIIGSSAPECRTIGQRDLTYGTNGIMSTLTATDYKQPKQILDKNLDESGVTICEQRCDEGIRFFKDNICGSLRTIDSCGDKRIIESGISLKNDTQKCDNTNLVNRIGGCFDTDNSTHQAGSVYDDGFISPTLDTMQGGYRQPCIEVLGKLECKGWHDVETRVYSTRGTSPTIETHNRGKYMNENNFKIRKLTPLECWRLMGFKDTNFYKAKELGVSDSQLYKQAGNSIVVNCLYYIFRNLFKEYISD